MAWAYKTSSAANNGNGGTSSSPTTCTLGAAVSIGDRVMVAISCWKTTVNPGITSVTDDLGNTYTLDKSTGIFTQDPGFPEIVALYSAAVTSAGTPTVSVAHTAEGLGVAVAAYSGLSTAAGAAAAVDVSASNISTGDPASSTATAATTAANELVIGIYGDDGQNQPSLATSGTSRTYRQSSTDADLLIEDQDSGASGGTQTTTHDINVSTPYAMLAVVYKLAGAAAAQVPYQPYYQSIVTQ